MTELEERQKKEEAGLEQGVINDAAESPEIGADVVAGVNRVAGNARESLQSAVPTVIEYNYPLKAKVDELIRIFLEYEGKITNLCRYDGDNIISNLYLKKDLRTGVLILESLEESLGNNDSLEIIAKKLAILHNFPDIVGGGGYNGMKAVMDLRNTLIRILLERLREYYSRDGDDAEKDPYFVYIANRTARLRSDEWEDKVRKRNESTDEPPLTGNAKVKAILTSVLWS